MSSTFLVDDMTCGHCASTIAKALAALDPDAKVNIDLGARRVEVASTGASQAELQEAIQEAGYTPALVQPAPAEGAQTKRSCGCGCG